MKHTTKTLLLLLICAAFVSCKKDPVLIEVEKTPPTEEVIGTFSGLLTHYVFHPDLPDIHDEWERIVEISPDLENANIIHVTGADKPVTLFWYSNYVYRSEFGVTPYAQLVYYPNADSIHYTHGDNANGWILNQTYEGIRVE